ncbi:MAG: alpha/beta fold hydrolase [Patescibacteria group bacterium]|nr:alpha/beta fold hydrolase [Patescibacteria group bacterium]MDD5715796.1 alpha/beta fold hydrolase [Patescibacteria group bacterium]
MAVFTSGDENAKYLALLIPGRLDTKDYANFVSHADYLAKRGFLAVAFDPPGTWDSPGGIDLCTTTNYLKAINELIEYFGHKPTLLVGHSRGAAAAILSSMVNSAVIGIVAIMPNLGAPSAPCKEDMQKGFMLSYRDFPPGTSKTKKQKEFRLPIAYWTDGKKYNPGEALQKCTKPKLLIFGTGDEFTPLDTARKSFEAIPEPKMLKVIVSGHGYRYHPQVIRVVNEEMGRFIKQYNLA